MTEMVNGEGSVVSEAAPLPVAPPAQEVQSEQVAERSFKQSEVNDIVKRAKSEAVDRFRRETSIASHQQPAQQPTQSPGGFSQDDVRRMAAEETQRLWDERVQDQQRIAGEQEADRIVREFSTKIEAGKANLPDFDKVMSDIDLRVMPYHMQLANMVDNTAEVMYELAKNPSKIGAIQNLIDMDMKVGRVPKLALMEMKRLSESLKTNANAANYRPPNEPLSQLRPSNAGTDNKGPRSVADYKRMFKV